MLVEKIIQGRFPICASFLVTSRSDGAGMWDADLEALLLLCGDFVLTQVSNADDQNVVFHLLRLPTMPVTLDDQRKRHQKGKMKRQ